MYTISCGFPGNERADFLAKSGAMDEVGTERLTFGLCADKHLRSVKTNHKNGEI